MTISSKKIDTMSIFEKKKIRNCKYLSKISNIQRIQL